MRLFTFRNLSAPALAIALCLSAGSARADFLVTYDNVYNGATPSGTSPFARATFQTISIGTVRLTLENLLPAGGQFIDEVYFNFNPALNPNILSFAFVSGQAAQTINTGINAVEPPGPGGDFDIQFVFENANNANRFTAGETSTYTITGAGINAESFLFNSVNEANSLLSVITVQGITQAGGGTISGDVGGTLRPVPEPASIVLVGLGALGLGGLARIRNRARA